MVVVDDVDGRRQPRKKTNEAELRKRLFRESLCKWGGEDTKSGQINLNFAWKEEYSGDNGALNEY